MRKTILSSLLALVAVFLASVAHAQVESVHRDLAIGSTGTDVSALQEFLQANDYLTMPAGVPAGYFGALTKAALASYQKAHGIKPAAGYFGPVTRSFVAAIVDRFDCSTLPGSAFGAATSSQAAVGAVWQVEFSQATFLWEHSGADDRGTYSCANGAIEMKLPDRTIDVPVSSGRKITIDGVGYTLETQARPI